MMIPRRLVCLAVAGPVCASALSGCTVAYDRDGNPMVVASNPLSTADPQVRAQVQAVSDAAQAGVSASAGPFGPIVDQVWNIGEALLFGGGGYAVARRSQRREDEAFDEGNRRKDVKPDEATA